jgi:thiamine transporter ThiT
MSKLFVAIAIALGMILSLVSMEELTGGSGLSWLELPIIIIGDFFARAISFDATTWGQSWALTLQFVAAVFFTESVVITLLRSRLERFNAERNVR